MLNAAVAAFYYLRVVVYMFMRDPASDAPALRHGALLWGGLAAASALTILLGLFPTGLLDAAGAAPTRSCRGSAARTPGCRRAEASGGRHSARS